MKLRAVPDSPPAEQAQVAAEADLQAGEAILRSMELAVRTKLDGLLLGNYLGLLPGPGTEAGESREYVPGDDVRRMDWPVTARTQVPHVRQTIVDRELESWLVVDLSPSLDFGTARSDKRQLLLAAVTALVHLTVRGGNRIGALVSTGELDVPDPGPLGTRSRPLSGPPHRRYAPGPGRDPRRPGRNARIAAAPAGPPWPRRGAVGLPRGRRAGRRLGNPEAEPHWQRPLRALSHHHQLLGVEVLDPRELELPASGLITFTDPESGAQLEVQTSDARLRANFATAASRQRAAIASGLRHSGAAHLQLRTDRDWLTDIVRFALAQRQVAGAAAGTRVVR